MKSSRLYRMNFILLNVLKTYVFSMQIPFKRLIIEITLFVRNSLFKKMEKNVLQMSRSIVYT